MMTSNGTKCHILYFRCRLNFLCWAYQRSDEEMAIRYKGGKIYYRCTFIITVLFILQIFYNFSIAKITNSSMEMLSNNKVKSALNCEKWITYKSFMSLKPVLENMGTGKFNKGTLYNIAFLESQRFGKWHCVIFHDVDLLPLDERILYSCPRVPTHMSSAVESLGFQLPYVQMFGGVTSLTIAQYDAVNGYSNFYWNRGGEDDDMFVRLQARRYPVVRYKHSIARYATLPHEPNELNDKRFRTLSLAKRRFRREGLRTLKYRLIRITKRNLFTHILADVNPMECKK